MKLKKIECSQWEDDPREWHLEDCTLGDVNLIVGKNASGKTRTLSVIVNLVRSFGSDKYKISEGRIRGLFEENKKEIDYVIDYKEGKVVCEKLSINGRTFLERKDDGTGEIFAEELNQSMNFQPSHNESTVATRHDAIQHPFLEILYNWGLSVIYFQFGKSMGQDKLFMRLPSKTTVNLDPKSTNNITEIFQAGKEKYDSKYTHLIIKDLNTVGFTTIATIDIAPVASLNNNDQAENIYGLKVIEEPGIEVLQHEISQGMFRTISLLIQLNFALLDKKPGCVIIDDIGEGLDHSRSSALIKLLIDKIQGTEIQLVMATNDRFVMNAVPLQYWSVIEGLPNKSKVYNYRNSQELFDEFEFTGLSNFDFFSSDYVFKNKEIEQVK